MTVVFDTTRPARVNPQKKNILIRRIARAPWWLLVMAVGVIAFVLSVSAQHPYPVIWGAVRQGIWTTIWVSVVAYALALVLGLIIALLRRSSNVIIYQVATFYVEMVRGIPTLVLVYWMALAFIPEVIRLGNNLGETLQHLTISFVISEDQVYELTFRTLGQRMAEFETREFGNTYRAIIALAISYSAFLSEVFRAGIESVTIGQREAARSLGMTQWQVMRLIVLPQAIRVILPPLGNDFIAMLKESSLVSVLGVQDITRRGQTYASSTFTFFQAYNIVALTYLVLTVTLSMVVKGMETYLGRGQRRGE
jgi:polar amino acid transport system permease protein